MWGRPVTIASLAGFDIKVDASWLIIAGLIVWSLASGYFPQALPDAASDMHLVLAVAAMLGLFASLILHELAHALMARRLGVPTAGITLFLFGGVAELQGEPGTPSAELRIAIVGPLASMVLAGLFWACGHVAATMFNAPPAVALFGYLAFINLALAVFNLVPAFPLDGGRVFRAILWARAGNLLKATRQAVTISSIFAWLLFALGVMSLFSGQVTGGLWPILLGLFLLAVARGTLTRMENEGALDGLKVADLMTAHPIAAAPDLTLEALASGVFLANAISFAPVMEEDVLLGSIDTRVIRRIDRENWATTTVEDVFENLSDAMIVKPSNKGAALMATMDRTGRRKFLVVEDKRLVGVITLSDLARYLAVSKELSSGQPSHA